METKDYMLVGACVVAAIILFIKMAKENKVFIGAGILFLLYGGYTVAQAFLDDGTVGVLSWILRGIAVIMLMWMFSIFSQERAKTKSQKNEDEPCEEELPDENESENIE